MKTFAIRRVCIVAVLALWAVGCTAPAGGASVLPTEPAPSAAPATPRASPASSGGGKYGDEYVDEYATPAP